MPRFTRVARFIQGITTTQGSSNNQSKGDGPLRSASSPRMQSMGDSAVQMSKQNDLFKIGRFGFPYEPTCVAVDPVQGLIAIGTKNGAIRMCGKPGAEYHIRHESNAPVQQIAFLINEGGLVCACGDSTLHMWNLRTTQPELTHSLKFNKEGLSCLCIPYGTKWLYVGTERGNIYVVNIETFSISGYDIRWNHVIDVSDRQAPGPVLKIEANPEDPAKLLLTYENGAVLWDLRTKSVQHTYKPPQDHQRQTTSAWSIDGSRFIAGYSDGSCAFWNYKNSKRPEDTFIPHALGGKAETAPHLCRIDKLAWISEKASDSYVFSGGLPPGNKHKGLTLIRGRSKSLLLTGVVVDFCLLGVSPWIQDQQDPFAIVVLLRDELIVFDLLTSGGPSVPWYEVPYTFDIHDSPVTCLQFYPDCPANFITALYLAESQRKKQSPAGQSKQKWPFTGGNTGEFAKATSCVVMTGGTLPACHRCQKNRGSGEKPAPILSLGRHADGTIKFWDPSSNSLYPLCKIHISKLLNQSVSRTSSAVSLGSKPSVNMENLEDCAAVQHIELCCSSRTLVAACSSNFVVVFKHYPTEVSKELTRIEASFTVEIAQEPSESPVEKSPTGVERKDSSSPETPRKIPKSPSRTSFPFYPLVKTTAQRYRAGFQPEVFCQQICNESSPFITCIALSSAYGIVAFGNALGVALIDYVQKTSIAVLMNYELGVLGDAVDNGSRSSNLQKSGNTTASAQRTNGSSEALQGAVGKEVDKSKDVKKSRTTRSSSGGEHQKVIKKASGNSLGSNTGGKDKEDGVFTFLKEKDIPVAGVICALMFAFSYTRKGASAMCPALWIGTSTGNVTVMAINMPPNSEERKRQPIIVQNTGLQVDLLSGITSIHLLNKDLKLCTSPYEIENSGVFSTPTYTVDCNEKHLLVLCSERRIKVKHLPSLKTSAEEIPVQDPNFIIKTGILYYDGVPCVTCLTSQGHVIIYSLPRLSFMKDIDCGIALNDYRLIRTFTFGKECEAIYLSSPSEIQRITFDERKSVQYRETIGSPFSVIQAPEPPQKGFFQSLFSAAASPLDREELFGSRAGNPARSVASYTAGVGGAVMRAQQQLQQRQEKLSKLEDKAQELRYKGETFADLSRQLAEKEANRKWWQL